jgi:hypothetical protein
VPDVAVGAQVTTVKKATASMPVVMAAFAAGNVQRHSRAGEVFASEKPLLVDAVHLERVFLFGSEKSRLCGNAWLLHVQRILRFRYAPLHVDLHRGATEGLPSGQTM